MAERDEALVLPAVLRGDDRRHPPPRGYWSWGRRLPEGGGLSPTSRAPASSTWRGRRALAAVCCSAPSRQIWQARGDPSHPGSNLPLATLGTWILWMGWFGFNGGSPARRFPAPPTPPPSAPSSSTPTPPRPPAWSWRPLVSKLILGKADLTMILNGALGPGRHHRRPCSQPAVRQPDRRPGRRPGGLRHRRPGSPGR